MTEGYGMDVMELKFPALALWEENMISSQNGSLVESAPIMKKIHSSLERDIDDPMAKM